MLYRHVYAYQRTKNPDLLAKFADSVIASITLHAKPEYARAVEAYQAAKQASTGQPVDINRLLADERNRRAG